jgi:hypothetical protein
MKDLLLILSILAAALYGFRVMKRLDRFLDTRVSSEDGEP